MDLRAGAHLAPEVANEWVQPHQGRLCEHHHSDSRAAKVGRHHFETYWALQAQPRRIPGRGEGISLLIRGLCRYFTPSHPGDSECLGSKSCGCLSSDVLKSEKHGWSISQCKI